MEERGHERAASHCWQLLWMAGHKSIPCKVKKATKACPTAQLAGEGAVAGTVLVLVALGKVSWGVTE